MRRWREWSICEGVAICYYKCYNIGVSRRIGLVNKPLKLIKVGNSTGVILPKEELTRLGLEAGDELNLNRTPKGIELSAGDADFEAQMAIAREVMRKRRAALRELAK